MKTNKRYGISMTYSQNRVKINYSFLKLFGKQFKNFKIHTFHPTQGPCHKAQDHVTKGVSFQGPILLEDWLWRPSSMRRSLFPSLLELGWLVVCLAREGSKRARMPLPNLGLKRSPEPPLCFWVLCLGHGTTSG